MHPTRSSRFMLSFAALVLSSATFGCQSTQPVGGQTVAASRQIEAKTGVTYYQVGGTPDGFHIGAFGKDGRLIGTADKDRFAVGERIHTEYSYKYAPAEFIALLERAGYGDAVYWQDESGDFAVYAARV